METESNDVDEVVDTEIELPALFPPLVVRAFEPLVRGWRTLACDGCACCAALLLRCGRCLCSCETGGPWYS